MGTSTQPVSYGYIARVFLKTGATAFGGWSTTALLLEKELVHTERITKTHLHGAVAYAQIIPGATQVQIVSNVGYRLKGARGAMLAAVCYVLPALSLFLLFSILYFHYVHSSQAISHLYGISAALGGVILANAYRIGKSHVTHPLMWLLVVAAAMAKLLLGINTVLIVLMFGVVGLSLSYLKTHRQKS